jgi:hypothetical protein
LLITNQKAQNPTLLGDLTGKTVTASFTVAGATGPLSYCGEPDACGGTASYVRFYFETTKAGGFDESQYWWSNPVSWPLANGSSGDISTTFDGSNWSDFYGHFGNDPAYAAGFAAALSNVTGIGVSFGGGCFFENGVGTSDGSGTFTLNSFSVS